MERALGKVFFRRGASAAVALLLLLSTSLRADVTTVASSAEKGPTILVIAEPFKGDLTIDVALRQAASWSLTRGKVVSAPYSEMAAAIKAEKPAAVLLYRTVRSSKEAANVSGRGIDLPATAATLSKLTESNGEPVIVGDAKLPETDASKVLRLSLAVKIGGTNPAARSRMFRSALHAILTSEQMTASDAWTLIQRQPGKINVAVYVGVGSDATPGVIAYPKCLTLDPDIRYIFVGAMEIVQPHAFDAFDAIVFPGGMSNAQAKTLGDDGAKAVQSFIKRGGGYVSSCAGSYLASSGYKWSIGLINTKVLDANHWLRGTGDVDIELTEEGKKIFGDYPGLQKIHYANGPLLAAANLQDMPAFIPLAYYRSDMAKSAPGGVMPNTPAIVASDFGNGRVLCFSPHPEYTAELNGFISRAVRWTLRKPFVEIKVPPVPVQAEGAAAKKSSIPPTTQPAAKPASATATISGKQTPFIAALNRNWSKWDADHDGILTAKEADAAVTDASNKGDDAAAAATLKLLLRTTKVAEPLTQDYFAKYNHVALPLVGSETLVETEPEAAVDPAALAASPKVQARSQALPVDWDSAFARCQKRIERRGTSPTWPTETPTLAALECMSQGPMGDCFFVACMGSAVAHRPAAVRGVITPLTDGKFRAAFPWTEPFTFSPPTDAQIAMSSRSTGDGAWLAVMEQAFGKYRSMLRGESGDIDGTDALRRGGDSAVTLAQLTGHATQRIHFPVSVERRAAEKEHILPELRKALTAATEEHRLITAGVDPPAAAKPLADGTSQTLPHLPPNINKNHVYAIVSYDPATDTVEIWNPHGQTFQPKGTPGLEHGYVTAHGRFKLPLTEAYSFYTSFTFELSAPATRPTKVAAKEPRTK